MTALSLQGEHFETQKSPVPSIAGSIEMILSNDQPSHANLTQQPMASEVLSHSLSPSDPDNPMNWPLYRKIYVSSCGFLFAASV
jgi:hypothetical protein